MGSRTEEGGEDRDNGGEPIETDASYMVKGQQAFVQQSRPSACLLSNCRDPHGITASSFSESFTLVCRGNLDNNLVYPRELFWHGVKAF